MPTADGPSRTDLTPRRISAGEWSSRRWEWLESLRRDVTLTMTARMVGHVLALEFAGHATGECFPGPTAVGEVLGVSPDTAKRALAELVDRGWIAREATVGGRGKAPRITFLSRAQVIHLRPAAAEKASSVKREKRGASVPPFEAETGASVPPFKGSERGASVRDKGGHPCPPNHSIEPYGRAGARARTRGAAADLDAQARDFADRLRAGERIPSFRITRTVARRIVVLGLMTETELLRCGVDC